MSIIIYGPPGCGKTRNAHVLAAYFCCTHIMDCDEEQDEFDPYPLSKKQVDEFKEGSILFLTTIHPDNNGYHGHYNRVYPYHLAAYAAGVLNANQPSGVSSAPTSGPALSETH